jgi:hypothetical protein
MQRSHVVTERHPFKTLDELLKFRQTRTMRQCDSRRGLVVHLARAADNSGDGRNIGVIAVSFAKDFTVRRGPQAARPVCR